MTCATTYTKSNGETGSAVVYQGTAPRRRRTTLRDRIARLHLDTISPDLAAAFDSPLWVGIDPSSSDDLTAVWVLHQEKMAKHWKDAKDKGMWEFNAP